MTTPFPFAALSALVLCAGTMLAQDKAAPEKKTFTITPTLQAAIDEWKTKVVAWAADPVIVAAVVEHNAKGPIQGMTNEEWKKLKKRDEAVKALQENAAGKHLAKCVLESKGIASEAFLNGASSAKVAFVEKTTSYLHKGKDKFDVPFTKNTTWQGAPELDESSQTFAIQIAVPVVEPPAKDEKDPNPAKAPPKPIGVLVVGLNLSSLEDQLKAAKPAK